MMTVLEAERVPIADARERVLAAPIIAGRDLPGFDNSSMDGFAIRAGDVSQADETAPVPLRVTGTSAAGGAFAGEVSPGTAVRIMTGAPIPGGADAVIEVEETSVDGETVLVRRAVAVGRNLRRAGGDLRRGELALESGAHVGPAQLALLAALGTESVECVRRPVVALVPTGDEVVDVGDEPGADQVAHHLGQESLRDPLFRSHPAHAHPLAVGRPGQRQDGPDRIVGSLGQIQSHRSAILAYRQRRAR